MPNQLPYTNRVVYIPFKQKAGYRAVSVGSEAALQLVETPKCE